MTSFEDLKAFFTRGGYNIIIASDAETRVNKLVAGQITTTIPAGGVSIALDPIARASKAIYIARGKSDDDRQFLSKDGKIEVVDNGDKYTLKRVFISENDFEDYYNGFSNQTLWPLCHVAFERPEINKPWYEGYKKVNQKFAQAIQEEIKGKTLVWINDYQLSLVPRYLGRQKNVVIAFFWHIPWPTWEVFRILPSKKEILESMLTCNYLGFHRGYQARNFLRTVDRELEVRIDDEKNVIHKGVTSTSIGSLPIGVDVDVIKSLIEPQTQKSIISKITNEIGKIVKASSQDQNNFQNVGLPKGCKVIIGVDRLDYTKGLRLRLKALDMFFQKNPKYKKKVVYLGILSPTRETIPAYDTLKKQIYTTTEEINAKYQSGDWKPIYLISKIFRRKELINFYQKSEVCLVTPVDDGMNLVSKEFVISSSFSDKPGMLVLSQFAGSAIDLTSAIIVNPYDTEELANSIKKALEMDVKEKKRRIREMVENLEEKNVYDWAKDFVRSAENSIKDSSS